MYLNINWKLASVFQKPRLGVKIIWFWKDKVQMLINTLNWTRSLYENNSEIDPVLFTNFTVVKVCNVSLLICYSWQVPYANVVSDCWITHFFLNNKFTGDQKVIQCYTWLASKSVGISLCHSPLPPPPPPLNKGDQKVIQCYTWLASKSVGISLCHSPLPPPPPPPPPPHTHTHTHTLFLSLSIYILLSMFELCCHLSVDIVHFLQYLWTGYCEIPSVITVTHIIVWTANTVSKYIYGPGCEIFCLHPLNEVT